MKTLQDRYAAALVARGATEVLPSPTSKARTFTVPKRADGDERPYPLFHFLGRSGAVRIGRNYTESHAVSDRFKAQLLPPLIEVGNKVQAGPALRRAKTAHSTGQVTERIDTPQGQALAKVRWSDGSETLAQCADLIKIS